MKMMASAMSVTDWTEIAPTKNPGDTGFALWRTRNFGDFGRETFHRRLISGFRRLGLFFLAGIVAGIYVVEL
jgi:hypothetical protein